jgi:ABC-2 type transport system permease protein
MNDILTLLKPRIWPLTNRSVRTGKRSDTLKLCVLAVIGTLLWSAIFLVAVRVLTYFRGIEEIGDILGFKLLSMILIIAFALLVFSSILTSLSRLYLSRDLALVHSMPVPAYKIFISRWIDSTVESAWMVVIFTLPVFLAYGIVYRAGAFYYADIIWVMTPLVINASAISTVMVMLSVMVIPANRLKSIFIFLGILFFVVIYLAIRLSRPELLVDPEVFDSVMVYITSLQTPASPLLPSTWAYDSIRAGLTGEVGSGLFHAGLAWSFAAALVFVLIMAADMFYFKGFSKTQAAAARLFRNRDSGRQYLNFLPGPVKSFAVKEIKTFLRDQTQWSQLFLVSALVVIYVYNFKVLPIEKSPIKTVYLQNLFSFLNMGLALFVLTAISARFAYPAVSMEREAFWLVRTSPLSLRSFLWIKFFIYYLPLLLLTEILVVATNILLNVTTFMMALSTITVFFLVPGIVAMGIGLGAGYPDFKAENPTQTVTSFGGLIFMILCAGYIGAVILIEAGPVYRIFMAHIHGHPLTPATWLWIIGSFSTALVFSILAIVLPMRFGENRLAGMRI